MSMPEVMSVAIDEISASVPHSEKEYMGEDGLLHCSVCHKAVQLRVEALEIKKTVRCICDCIKKEMQEFEDRKRREELDRQRRICFAETNMENWTFANDDRQNVKLSTAMERYVNNFTEFKEDGKGLLLYGPVGTGKTYYAAAIANALIDKGYTAYMTSFTRLTDELQGKFGEKQAYIDSLNRNSLLIIDDLGVERKSEYMQEMVYDIINRRYITGLPFIVTTNLTMAEIKKPQEVSYARIYDRILERCFPVEVPGQSRRRQNVRDTFFDVKEKLGL